MVEECLIYCFPIFPSLQGPGLGGPCVPWFRSPSCPRRPINVPCVSVPDYFRTATMKELNTQVLAHCSTTLYYLSEMVDIQYLQVTIRCILVGSQSPTGQAAQRPAGPILTTSYNEAMLEECTEYTH